MIMHGTTILHDVDENDLIATLEGLANVAIGSGVRV